jgi:Copper transport outer membrane protein, MctB
MFDLRYHAASLLAVFVALILGIVVGVGLSGRGLVEESERRNLNRQIDELEQQLAEAGDRTRAQAAASAFVAEAYDAVMRNRLADGRVALLFLGSVDEGTREAAVEAISAAGGNPVRLRALELPVDPEAIASALASKSAVAGFSGEDQLENLGRAMGRELVSGGETPLWDALGGELVRERSGSSATEVDGVVVARSAGRAQGGATARFLDGLYAGLQGDVPVVGVEVADAETSAIPVYRRVGLSSVDNVDEELGRIALVVLLAGGPSGHYGVKATADAVVPPIEPLAPSEAG